MRILIFKIQKDISEYFVVFWRSHPVCWWVIVHFISPFSLFYHQARIRDVGRIHCSCVNLDSWQIYLLSSVFMLITKHCCDILFPFWRFVIQIFFHVSYYNLSFQACCYGLLSRMHIQILINTLSLGIDIYCCM